MSILFQIIFSELGIVSIILVTRAIIKMKKLNNKFNRAIVLIPLYKRNYRIFTALGVLFALLGVSIYAVSTFEEKLFYATIIVILLSVMAFSVARLYFKCGILDIGIIVPYKFMDFTCKFEYIFDEDGIVFYKDKNGYDTLNCVTESLRFDKNNLEKLKYVLKGHQSK